MWIGIVLLAFGLAILLLAIAWRGATELIHPPHRRATITPADYHLAYETVSFRSRDGLTLRGWFIPAENPHGTIIVCHGYTGDCTPDLQYAPLFHQRHLNTLYFDFRGHGMSDGNYTSLVYYERFDVLAALDFLKARGIARAGLFGLSMGGAVALSSASLSPMIVGVVSDCTFAELWRVIAHHSIKRGVPGFLSGIAGWLIVAMAGLRLHANLFSADPIHHIDQISPRPILLMHAEKDDAAPASEAHRLLRAAREPKTLWIVPRATHRAIEELAPDEYRARVIKFFERIFDHAKREP